MILKDKDMKKLLWLGDAVVPTGFGRVTHSVLDSLQTEYELHVIGINYRGDPHDYNYKIYPAFLGGDLYGIRRLKDIYNDIKPDVIGILNDPPIINMYLEFLETLEDRPKVVVYFPIDSTGLYEDWFYRYEKIVDHVCVYTEFGKTEFRKACPNYPEENITIIPHGIDKSKFFPVDKKTAKERVYPKERIEEMLNSFIVFNGNRNQPRKRVDLTLVAFNEFAKGKPDAKLYLHMGTPDAGVDLVRKAVQLGIDDKLLTSLLTLCKRFQNI